MPARPPESSSFRRAVARSSSAAGRRWALHSTARRVSVSRIAGSPFQVPLAFVLFAALGASDSISDAASPSDSPSASAVAATSRSSASGSASESSVSPSTALVCAEIHSSSPSPLRFCVLGSAGAASGDSPWVKARFCGLDGAGCGSWLPAWAGASETSGSRGSCETGGASDSTAGPAVSAGFVGSIGLSGKLSTEKNRAENVRDQ